MQYTVQATTTISVASSNGATSLLNSPLSVSLLDGAIGLILAASIAAYVSLKQIGFQKVRDNIEKRYLENGLEKLISHLNFIRLESEDTYARAVSVVQHLRDLNKEDFKKWFLAIKPKDYRHSSPGMPDSLITTGAFIKDKLFQYLAIKISLIINSSSDFFTTEFFRLIENEFENEHGLFELKARTEPKKWKEIMDKVKNELTRHHNQNAPVYELVPVLELILIRLRELNLHSYKKFIEKARSDEKILGYYNDIKNILLKDITNSYATILEYISLLEQKRGDQLRPFKEQDLAGLTSDVEKISSNTPLTDNEIIAIEQKIDEAIIQLRWIMGGVIVV